MSPSLAEIQDLRTALGRLDAERPAGFESDSGRTMHAQRDGDFLERLDLDVASRQGKARILVTGQIGVGKSSELFHYIRLARRDSPNRLWIFCDLEKEEHPDHCGPTGVLLTIFRDCWAATQMLRPTDPTFLRLRDEAMTRLIEWLSGRYSDDRTTVHFRFGGMDYPVTARGADPNRTLALILGKAAQHEAVSKPSDRFGIAPDSLVLLLNRLLEWMAWRCKDLAPVLVVDHVDKIRNPLAAEEVLVKATPAWDRLAASLIMTAPFEYTLGELRNSIESKWGRPQILFPVGLPDLQDGPVPKIYDSIVRDAGLRPLLVPQSLRILAYYSGGILRHYVQLLKDACKAAYLARHDRIEVADAEAVVRAAEQSYLSYSTRDLELLDHISQFGTGLGEAATLLRSPIGLLVTIGDRGEQTLRIHPLAEAALQRFRVRRKVSA